MVSAPASYFGRPRFEFLPQDWTGSSQPVRTNCLGSASNQATPASIRIFSNSPSIDRPTVLCHRG
jgi:hypothetical protein